MRLLVGVGAGRGGGERGGPGAAAVCGGRGGRGRGRGRGGRGRPLPVPLHQPLLLAVPLLHLPRLRLQDELPRPLQLQPRPGQHCSTAAEITIIALLKTRSFQHSHLNSADSPATGLLAAVSGVPVRSVQYNCPLSQ